MKSDPMLSVPREGRPLAGRVAVVYRTVKRIVEEAVE